MSIKKVKKYPKINHDQPHSSPLSTVNQISYGLAHSLSFLLSSQSTFFRKKNAPHLLSALQKPLKATQNKPKVFHTQKPKQHPEECSPRERDKTDTNEVSINQPGKEREREKKRVRSSLGQRCSKVRACVSVCVWSNKLENDRTHQTLIYDLTPRDTTKHNATCSVLIGTEKRFFLFKFF